MVGIPTLVGSVKYIESGIRTRIEANGHYNNGYFLECFVEYFCQVSGCARFGLFGRWNMAQGKASLNVGFIQPPVGYIPNDAFQVALHRNSWTLGGAFSLDFTLY